MTVDNKNAKTLEAIEQIKAILREHDLWASFTVIDGNEHAHWVYHFEPSWSCLSFNPVTGEAKLKAKRADFVTIEQFQRVINLTTGAIIATRDFGVKAAVDAGQLYRVLASKFDIRHEYSDLEIHKPKGAHEI